MLLFEALIGLVIAGQWARVRASEDPQFERRWAGPLKVWRVAFIMVLLGLVPAMGYAQSENAGPFVAYFFALFGGLMALLFWRRRRMSRAAGL